MKKLVKLCGILFLTSGMLFVSCDKEDDPEPTPVITTVPVTGVSLNKDAVSLKVNGTETLTATVAPTDATDKTVTWTSTVTTVATVANGLVTAVAEGSSLIIVTAGNYKDTCTVTVTNDTPMPTNGVVTVKLGDFAEWTADSILGITNSAHSAFELIAYKKGSGIPRIGFLTSTVVSTSGEYYSISSSYFNYFQETFFENEDGDIIGDWYSVGYAFGGITYPGSAGVIITSFDPVGLTISGTFTGFLVSTQEYIVDGSTDPTRKSLTGSFTNIKLVVSSVAKNLKIKNMPTTTPKAAKLNTNGNNAVRFLNVK